MSSFRTIAVIGTILLLAAAVPARATLLANALTLNGVALNAVAPGNGALDGLSGVMVEGVTLPQDPLR